MSTPFVLPERPPEFWQRTRTDMIRIVETNYLQEQDASLVGRMIAGLTEAVEYFAREAESLHEANAKALAERDRLVNRCNYLEDLCGDSIPMGAMSSETLEALSSKQPPGPFLVVDLDKSVQGNTLVFWEEGSDHYTSDIGHAKKYRSLYAAQMATIDGDHRIIAETKARIWKQLPKAFQENAIEDAKHSIWG